jgi:hypothetical protein
VLTNSASIVAVALASRIRKLWWFDPAFAILFAIYIVFNWTQTGKGAYGRSCVRVRVLTGLRSRELVLLCVCACDCGCPVWCAATCRVCAKADRPRCRLDAVESADVAGVQSPPEDSKDRHSGMLRCCALVDSP